MIVSEHPDYSSFNFTRSVTKNNVLMNSRFITVISKSLNDPLIDEYPGLVSHTINIGSVRTYKVSAGSQFHLISLRKMVIYFCDIGYKIMRFILAGLSHAVSSNHSLSRYVGRGRDIRNSRIVNKLCFEGIDFIIQS